MDKSKKEKKVFLETGFGKFTKGLVNLFFDVRFDIENPVPKSFYGIGIPAYGGSMVNETYDEELVLYKAKKTELVKDRDEYWKELVEKQKDKIRKQTQISKK